MVKKDVWWWNACWGWVCGNFLGSVMAFDVEMTQLKWDSTFLRRMLDGTFKVSPELLKSNWSWEFFIKECPRKDWAIF